MKPEDIKQLRETLNETFDQFAGRIGVSANSIRRWESGKVKPHPYWITKLRRIRGQALQSKAG